MYAGSLRKQSDGIFALGTNHIVQRSPLGSQVETMTAGRVEARRLFVMDDSNTACACCAAALEVPTDEKRYREI